MALCWGIINYDCCPKGVPEIKGPFCHRDESTSAAVAKDKKFCLTEVNGHISLNCNHAYYYQVQTQIFVCDIEYCISVSAPSLGMRSLHFVLKESQKMMHSERMNLYQNQKLYSIVG